MMIDQWVMLQQLPPAGHLKKTQYTLYTINILFYFTWRLRPSFLSFVETPTKYHLLSKPAIIIIITVAVFVSIIIKSEHSFKYYDFTLTEYMRLDKWGWGSARVSKALFASPRIRWHFFVYAGPTPLSNCTCWCLSTISNSVIPCKVRYLCFHWKSNFTPIKSCNNRIYNPVLQAPSILPGALTMWYNEVSRKLSMMIIIALPIFFLFRGWSNEMGRYNLKKSAIHDSGASVQEKMRGGGFQEIKEHSFKCKVK